MSPPSHNVEETSGTVFYSFTLMPAFKVVPFIFCFKENGLRPFYCRILFISLLTLDIVLMTTLFFSFLKIL